MSKETAKHFPINPEIPIEVKKQPENQKIVDMVLSDFNCPDAVVEMIEEGDVHFVYRVELSPQKYFYIKIRRNHFKSNPNISIDPKEILSEKKSIDIINGCLPDVAPNILKFYPEFSVLCLEDVVGENETVANLLITTDTKNYEELGNFIGNLHKSLENRKDLVRGDFEETFYKNSLYYRLGFLNISEVDDLVQDLYKLPKQLIHGDLTPWNIVWDKENHKFRLYDLETLHYGDPIFDLAFLEAHIILENFSNPAILNQLLASFRKAYLKTYLIDQEDLEVRLAYALVYFRLKGKSNYEPKNKIDNNKAEDVCLKIIKEPKKNSLSWNQAFL